MAETIRVLHVDDDPDILELTATYLEEKYDQFIVETVTDPAAGLQRLTEEPAIDCVVSDYEMPDMDGITLLNTVREDHPALPFILFTGKGSEAVAGQAINAGVTEYLQKGPGTDQYDLLAHRIKNAVEKWRAQQEARIWSRAIQTASEGIAIIDEDGTYADMNTAYADLYGTTPEELIGEPWTTTVPPEEVQRQKEDVFPNLDDGEWRGESVGQRVDGSTYPKLLSIASLGDGGHICIVRDMSDRKAMAADLRQLREKYAVLFENIPAMIAIHAPDGTITEVNARFCERLHGDEDDFIGQHIGVVDADIDTDTNDAWAAMDCDEVTAFETMYRRLDGTDLPVEGFRTKAAIDGDERLFVMALDVTDQREREHELQRQNERLEEFASVVSHDLQSPLSVAQGRLDLARDECDSAHLDEVADAHDRMTMLIEDLLALAREGNTIAETEPVTLAALVADCWRTVETADATITIETDQVVEADASRLRQLLENLLRNAIAHGGSDVTITIGDLPNGFFVEDDGPGIPADQRDRIFELGYSTADDGTGFGLRIVQRIAQAHGWSVAIADGSTGGARFEITGLTTDRE